MRFGICAVATLLLLSGGATVVLAFVFPYAASAHEVERDGEVVIHMTDSGFDPAEVRIPRGTRVVFENVGESEHWPASNIHPTHRVYPGSDFDDCGTPAERRMFDACRGIKPGHTYAFEFNEVGEWRFHDHLYPTLTGKVIVEEVGATPRNADSIVSGEGGVRGMLVALWKSVKRFVLSLVGGGRSEDTARAYDAAIGRGADIFNDPDGIYSYVRKYNPQQTLSQLKTLEGQYGNCHNDAHYVGRFAYELYDAEAFRLCDMQCQSGCYHGAVEAYFRDKGTQDLSENLNKLCSGNINPFVTHQCLHGVGHGLMAWSSYALFDALESCDLLASGQSSCYSGVFMENITQSMAEFLGIEGHATEYLSEDPHYPCNVVEEKYRPTCYFLQTDRFVQLFGSDFGEIASACAEVPDAFSRRMCFESMGRTVGGHNRGNPEGSIAACSHAASGEDRLDCLEGAVQDTFWDPSGQDIALRFCRLLNDQREKQRCYNVIFGRAPQVLSSAEDRSSFCAKTEPAFAETCRAIVGGS